MDAVTPSSPWIWQHQGEATVSFIRRILGPRLDRPTIDSCEAKLAHHGLQELYMAAQTKHDDQATEQPSGVESRLHRLPTCARWSSVGLSSSLPALDYWPHWPDLRRGCATLNQTPEERLAPHLSLSWLRDIDFPPPMTSHPGWVTRLDSIRHPQLPNCAIHIGLPLRQLSATLRPS